MDLAEMTPSSLLKTKPKRQCSVKIKGAEGGRGQEIHDIFALCPFHKRPYPPPSCPWKSAEKDRLGF